MHTLTRSLLLLAMLGTTLACNDSDSVEYKFVSDPDGDGFGGGGGVVVINDPPELTDSPAGAAPSATPRAAPALGAQLMASSDFTDAELKLGPEAADTRREAALAASRIFAGEGRLAELILGLDGSYSGFVFNGWRDGDWRVPGAGNFAGRWQRDGDTLLFSPRQRGRELALSLEGATGTFTSDGLVVDTRDGPHHLNSTDTSSWPLWEGLGRRVEPTRRAALLEAADLASPP